MAENNLIQEEQDHNSFLFFYLALERASLPAEDASEKNGHYNTAWETQQELTGQAHLIHSPVLNFSEEQKDALAAFLERIAALPAEAVSPKGADTRTIEGDIASLHHPAWAALRPQAEKLAKILAAAVDRSHAFLEKSQS